VVYSLNGTEPFWLSGKHLINEAHTGILMFRLSGHKPTVLLVHPGGPFWQNKDRNSWSIPKDEFGDDATAETAAVREFEEETGFRPTGVLLPLGEAIQTRGKRVTAFAMAGDLDADRIAYPAMSNGHQKVDGSSTFPRWTAPHGLRSTTRGTRSSRDKASFSTAWNKSSGRGRRRSKKELSARVGGWSGFRDGFRA
jgi:predicted NUDIX family NTP pyrophosphohydrolase